MPKRKRDTELCAICMETPKNKATLDGCSHSFCRKCIVKWSKTENSCPVCRKSFTLVQTSRSKTKIKRRRQISDEDNFVGDIVTRYLISDRFKVIFAYTIYQSPLDIRLMQLVEQMYTAYCDTTILEQMPEIEGELQLARECIERIRNDLIYRIMTTAIEAI